MFKTSPSLKVNALNPGSSLTVGAINYTSLRIPLIPNVSTAKALYSTQLHYDLLTSTLNSVSYGSLSDPRYKENLTIINSWKWILDLKAYSYNFKLSGEKSFGFLTTEVETIQPEFVKTVLLSEVDELGNNSYNTLNYNAFIPFLTLGLGDHEREIKELTKKLVTVSQEMQDLKRALAELKESIYK